MQTSTDLKNLLNRIDRRSYPAYKDTKGEYRFPGYVLSIDHVQGDPFASPSKVSIRVSGQTALFPQAYYIKPHLRIALQDYLTRRFYRAALKYTFKTAGSGKSGLIGISRCDQEILERTACNIDDKTGDLTVRMEIGFPASGRTIRAGELIRILFEYLPECVENALLYKNCDPGSVRQVVELAEDQDYIRKQLAELGLVAFVANGSILPRESGVSSHPMKGSVPFESPKEMEITMNLPHRGALKGMGIRRGVTLIVGGGYHGKSTLLRALELGVYNHVAGDGREYVITDDTAMKIRAEDGRCIHKTDISMFINNLPNGKDTGNFSTEDASGSTSQAAGVIESMEAGCKVLLMDEDTSATNFMIRDELMQRVIHRDMEPITPFIDRIRELYERHGISSVIVAGSSGAYFHVADTILQMDRYIPREITAAAKKEAENFPAMQGIRDAAGTPDFNRIPRRMPALSDGSRVKMKILPREGVQINRDLIDLRCVEQIADSEQLSALGWCVLYAARHLIDGRMTVREIAGRLADRISHDGLCALCGNTSSVPNMAAPRKAEIAACLNRCRFINMMIPG